MAEPFRPTLAAMIEAARGGAEFVAAMLGGEPEDWLGECWLAVERSAAAISGASESKWRCYYMASCLHACRRAKHLDSRIYSCSPKVKAQEQKREAEFAMRLRWDYFERQEERLQAVHDFYAFERETPPDVIEILKEIADGRTHREIELRFWKMKGWTSARLAQYGMTDIDRKMLANAMTELYAHRAAPDPTDEPPPEIEDDELPEPRD